MVERKKRVTLVSRVYWTEKVSGENLVRKALAVRIPAKTLARAEADEETARRLRSSCGSGTIPTPIPS